MQDKDIEDISNTIGKSILMKPEQIARLRYSQDFPSTNIPRLRKELTNTAIRGLKDINHIMKSVSESYQYEILNSKECDDFLAFVLQKAALTIAKQDAQVENVKELENSKQNPVSANFNAKLFTATLEGFVKSIPAEFRPIIIQQLRPIVSLLQAINDYSNAVTGRPHPQIRIPSTLLEPA